MTFLRNHRDLIAAMDFFVVSSVRFRLLYVWFAIDHERRRILHLAYERWHEHAILHGLASHRRYRGLS